MKKIALLVAVLLLVGGSLYFLITNGLDNPLVSTPSAKNKIAIGLSLDTLIEERWKTDRDLMIKKAEESDAILLVAAANGDDSLQISQIENFIGQNVDVLIVVPHDESKLAGVINDARRAGIKVIAYDRPITSAPIDAYVTFDYIKAGEQQAQAVVTAIEAKLASGAKAKPATVAVIMGAESDATVPVQRTGIMNVLKPKVDAGELKIVLEAFSKEWKPDEAYKNLKAYLDKQKSIDGVVAMNDGTAFGSIQALKESKLDGQVPVSGMDAELAGCQQIVAGIQTQTSYLPIYLEADKAIESALDLYSQAGFSTRKDYLLAPISVTKDNMLSTIIKDGFHTYDEVYKFIPEKDRPLP